MKLPSVTSTTASRVTASKIGAGGRRGLHDDRRPAEPSVATAVWTAGVMTGRSSSPVHHLPCPRTWLPLSLLVLCLESKNEESENDIQRKKHSDRSTSSSSSCRPARHPSLQRPNSRWSNNSAGHHPIRGRPYSRTVPTPKLFPDHLMRVNHHFDSNRHRGRRCVKPSLGRLRLETSEAAGG